MLVTSYYDLYNKPEKFIEYLYLFYDLGISGIPITIFVDPSMVYKFRIFPSTVTVIGLPLADCELYSIAMRYNRELPVHRTPQKDTKEFFALMNSKMEFLRRASFLHCNCKTFAWIDFGILKIVKDTVAFIEKLRQLDTHVFTKVTIPGCWGFGRTFTVEQIHWRFCGGFLIMPMKHVERFYQHSKGVLTDFCTQQIYKLTWETNVWTVIESCAERDNIEWYMADHNDSIVMNVDSVVSLTSVDQNVYPIFNTALNA